MNCKAFGASFLYWAYSAYSFFRWRSQRKANCDGTELYPIQRSILQRWICFWRGGQNNFLYSRLWLWTPSVDHNFIFSASKTGPTPVFHYFLNVSIYCLAIFDHLWLFFTVAIVFDKIWGVKTHFVVICTPEMMCYLSCHFYFHQNLFSPKLPL